MFPRWMDSTLLGGAYNALQSYQSSQLVVLSYAVLLSAVLVSAKLIGRKNGALAIGIAVALVMVIPGKAAHSLSHYTMVLAHQVGKYLERSQHQAMFYNVISVGMIWLPWLILDLLPGDEKKNSKKGKKTSKKKD
eukprot:TRINITY_DN96620_c0_g1_i1.p1 TRINITY_DN96620_c0_g1~~TRINITY_DN96620_c0_g1_i1.p1  ORF type:complete len:135 (+),score=14.80 TRINITY_DN96620_c0_g1_i1:95-499(+)